MSYSGTYEEKSFQYLDTDADLEKFCEELSGASYLAIDTEFLRENTYYPELCLVQLKYEDKLACVDTQTIKDLAPLSAILHADDVTKVFHAGSQDMEIFVMLDKQAPSPVFDTQIAAPLLGYQEQIGYGNLVKEALGVTLPKAHTRADWSRRPIPEKQLQYALDDVIYLETLYLDLTSRLEKHGRRSWLDTEFAEMSEMEKYNKPARHMWQKLRAAQTLKGEQLATLQALAEWRELHARESNRPKTWIMKDDAIADLARHRPTSKKELEHIRSLAPRTRDKLGDKLLAVIKDAATREPVPLPDFVRKQKPGKHAAVSIDALTAVVSVIALENNINPTLLATRKQLQECVTSGGSSPLTGWRRALLGEPVDDFLNGRTAIVYEGDKTRLNPSSA